MTTKTKASTCGNRCEAGTAHKSNPEFNTDLLAVLTRIAEGIEMGNARTEELASVAYGIANRIEDLTRAL